MNDGPIPIPPRLHTLDSSRVSPTAAHAIRANFNVSNDGRIGLIKLLTGSLITELENLGQSDLDAQPLCAEAIKHVQTASMWSVLAASDHLARGGR